QVVDIDLTFHIPVDNFGYISATARAAEGRAAPHASGDELKRARSNLLTRAGNADDDALAPTAMTALQRLAHGCNVTDAFEREIGPSTRQVNDSLHYFVAADSRGVHEVCHA